MSVYGPIDMIMEILPTGRLIVACVPPASQEHIAYTCTIFFPRQGQSMNNSSRHVQLLYILLKLGS